MYMHFISVFKWSNKLKDTQCSTYEYQSPVKTVEFSWPEPPSVCQSSCRLEDALWFNLSPTGKICSCYANSWPHQQEEVAEAGNGVCSNMEACKLALPKNDLMKLM